MITPSHKPIDPTSGINPSDESLPAFDRKPWRSPGMKFNLSNKEIDEIVISVSSREPLLSPLARVQSSLGHIVRMSPQFENNQRVRQRVETQVARNELNRLLGGDADPGQIGSILAQRKNLSSTLQLLDRIFAEGSMAPLPPNSYRVYVQRRAAELVALLRNNVELDTEALSTILPQRENDRVPTTDRMQKERGGSSIERSNDPVRYLLWMVKSNVDLTPQVLEKLSGYGVSELQKIAPHHVCGLLVMFAKAGIRQESLLLAVGADVLASKLTPRVYRAENLVDIARCFTMFGHQDPQFFEYISEYFQRTPVELSPRQLCAFAEVIDKNNLGVPLMTHLVGPAKQLLKTRSEDFSHDDLKLLVASMNNVGLSPMKLYRQIQKLYQEGFSEAYQREMGALLGL